MLYISQTIRAQIFWYILVLYSDLQSSQQAKYTLVRITVFELLFLFTICLYNSVSKYFWNQEKSKLMLHFEVLFVLSKCWYLTACCGYTIFDWRKEEIMLLSWENVKILLKNMRLFYPFTCSMLCPFYYSKSQIVLIDYPYISTESGLWQRHENKKICQ